MAHRLPPVDAVTVGVGWTGGILAHQLAEAGLTVVGLERGGYRATKPDFQPPHVHDELRYAVRYELMQDLSRETLTFRNNRSQRALPMRTLGSFLLGEGLGGAGVHWNGQTWRFLPYTFEARSRAVARYGEGILPQDNTIQDWGVTYDELAPFYDRFERTCGVGGVAGNLGGAVQPGGNPFEGPRGPYPNPPMKTSYAQHLYKEAAEGMGLHPFPGPSANSTTEYTNPDGMQLGACHYCGYCERFGCEIYAKASPQATVIPAALKTGNFELRTGAHVTRVLMSPDGTRATGVLYVDAQGREVEQPAEMVLLTAYGLHNARLMMLSGIGETYDPATGRGTVGRNTPTRRSRARRSFSTTRTSTRSPGRARWGRSSTTSTATTSTTPAWGSSTAPRWASTSPGTGRSTRIRCPRGRRRGGRSGSGPSRSTSTGRRRS